MEQDTSVPGVAFIDERVTQISNTSSASKLTAWVVRASGGAIKDERQAVTFLVVFIILAIALSLFFFIFKSTRHQSPPPPIMDDTFVPRSQSPGF
jgi:hypothetical protein